jgi:hypothetical protein
MSNWPSAKAKKVLASVSCLATLLLQDAATAQSPLGRYAGSSKYWRPDYVGTLRMRSSGAVSFTALADVELQRQQEDFPGAGIYDYEMRGLITITSPLQTTDKGITTTCQLLTSVVPVQIGRSKLRLYRGDDEAPKNSYEIEVFQSVPLGECVSSDGSRSTIPFNSMEVSFDSTQMAFDGRPPSPMKLPESPKPFTPSEQAVADQLTKAADAMLNHPEMQRGIQELIDRARREGREITAQESLALVERLRRQGVIPERLPSFSPERESELRGLGGEHSKIDTSHLRRTPSFDRLEDQITSQAPSGITQTFQWSLRRTGNPPSPGR